MSFKIGMVGILNNPNKKNRLVEIHRQLVEEIYATCDILTEQDDWNSYQYLIINDSRKDGKLNGSAKRAEKLMQYAAKMRGVVVSGPRLDYKPSKALATLNCKLPQTLTISELPLSRITNKLLLGDGHAMSVWPGPDHNLEIHREMPLSHFLEDPQPADWYYFGNNDVRHLCCRKADPVRATKSLVDAYIALAREHNAKVTCLLPVESEKRIIPKSYMVDGKPFHGSRELRVELVELFNAKLRSSGLEVHEWPTWWYEKPYLYETTVMEPKPSVYIKS